MHEFKRRFPPPPPDWSRPRLADIADRVTARNVERNANVLTISAEFGLISQTEFFSRRVASESVGGYFLLQKGDFAYNKSYSRGYPLGAIRRLDRYEKGCVSPLYIVFRPRAEAVDSDFLLHYLDGGAIDSGLADVAKEGIRNHGLLNVGVSDFFSLEVPLPPAAEQRVAARILNTLDTTIRQTQAIIEKLTQVKQGLLHDLLTRGIGDNGELRPPQGEAPHLYKDSSLGWIPREWEVGGISRYLDVDDGIKPGPFGSSIKKESYAASGFKVFGQEQVISGDQEIGDYFIPLRKFQELQDFAVAPGDVLISLVGTIGKVLVLKEPLRPGLINPRLMRLRPNKNDALPEFVGLLVSSNVYARQVMANAGGGTMPVINKRIVSQIQVPVLPLSEQVSVWQTIVAADKRIDAEQQEAEKLVKQKSGLMDDLLTGRVRVTPLLA